MDEIKVEAFDSLGKVESDLEKVCNCIKNLEEFVQSGEWEVSSGIGTEATGSSVQVAEFMVLLCFTINTLSYITLKLQGVPTKSHKVKEELNRCQKYFKKIDSVKAQISGPRLAVDKEATKRFVNAGLANEKGQHQRFDNHGKLIS